jgi:hypothetical protein
MSISVTFDGVALSNPSPVNMGYSVLLNKRTLVSGKTSVQASPETAEQHRFRCTAEQAAEDGTLPAEVTALLAKVGTKGSLVIGGKTVAGCYIGGITNIRMLNSVEWEYEVEFIQETA